MSVELKAAPRLQIPKNGDEILLIAGAILAWRGYIVLQFKPGRSIEVGAKTTELWQFPTGLTFEAIEETGFSDYDEQHTYLAGLLNDPDHKCVSYDGDRYFRVRPVR